MILGNEKALFLLFAVPVVLVPLYVWCFWRKSKALKVLASREMLNNINVSVSFKRQMVKGVFCILAFASIVIALTEPKWNPRPRQVRQRGRDVVILLDTSRSMLAEDIKPNRLERSKIAIGDLLERLKGDRLAIVTFAGSSSIKCPLTSDYSFVRMALSDITTESTVMGGTLIGDAIRKVTEDVFDEGRGGYKDLILITDGNDQDSFPVEAGEKAGAAGIRIIAIGLGDDDQGARIPIRGAKGEKSFLKYEGREVWSRVDGNMLRRVVLASEGGKYLSFKPGTTFDLGEIYSELIESARKRELEATTMMEYDEKFQIFLVLGLVLILCEVFVSERKKS